MHSGSHRNEEKKMCFKLHHNRIITLKNQQQQQQIITLLHFGTEKELEQGTATDDIAAGDPPSDLASSVPALILSTPDGPDPLSDLASSVPALSPPLLIVLLLAIPLLMVIPLLLIIISSLPLVGWNLQIFHFRLLQLQHLPSLFLQLLNLHQMWFSHYSAITT